VARDSKGPFSPITLLRTPAYLIGRCCKGLVGPHLSEITLVYGPPPSLSHKFIASTCTRKTIAPISPVPVRNLGQTQQVRVATLEMPPQIKQDLNRSGWETTDFPSVCERCLPENPYVQMLKEDYGAVRIDPRHRISQRLTLLRNVKSAPDRSRSSAGRLIVPPDKSVQIYASHVHASRTAASAACWTYRSVCL
jgi:hypothetical protein